MVNEELMHHGTKGMKWGVRRYQNKDGSLTPAGKKRYERDEADYEKQKEEALKSGSATDVLKYKGKLTPQELRSALDRIRLENDLKSISDKEMAAGKERIDKIFNTVDSVTNKAVTLAKAYNTAVNVINAFSGTDGISLPKIDTNNANDNKAIRRVEKDKAEKKAKEAAEARKSEEAKSKEEKKAAREEAKTKRAEKKAAREEAKAERKAARESRAKEKAHTGKVYGEPKSKRSDPEDIIIDAEFWDIPSSNVPARYTSTGARYIAGLLEDKR